jgi:hypothetical protein
MGLKMMRSWHWAGCVSLAFAALTSQTAAAQMISDGDNAKRFTEAGNRLSGQSAASADSVGVSLAPGLVWTPSGFIEGGYDTNPDRYFEDDHDAAYMRTGAAMSLTAISKRTIARVNASGNWLGFAEDIDHNSRLSGNVNASITQQLAHGLTFTASGLLEHDASKYVASDLGGASTELGYRSDVFGAFVRGRFLDVRYANDFPLTTPQAPENAPFYRSSAFNAQKSEISAGAILLPRLWASPYFEGGAGQIDYTKQPHPAALNRDGDDYYAKTGVRVVFSPNLRADVGWRWNERNLEDTTVSSFNSDFFDGSVTWTPSRFFAMTASIERTIGEPTTAFGRLSDLRTFELKANYRPVNGVSLTLGVQRQMSTDVGGDYYTRTTALDAGATYDYTKRVQLYTGLRYEYYEADWREMGGNRIKAMAGVRFIPDGRDMLKGGGFDRLAESLSRPRLPNGAELTVSAGYSWFNLPGVKMTTIVGGPFFDQSIGQMENHDGDVDGGRVDVRLTNMARYVTEGGHAISFGLSGFYGAYYGSQNSKCDYTASTDCAFVNIVDFDKNEENNTGAFGMLDIRASRDVDYYGVALDARLGAFLGGSLKDRLPDLDYSPIKVGVAARGLNERTKLYATDPGVCLPVRYNEKLDTHYFGGFLGLEKQFSLGNGWSANFDSAAGVYYADTMYQGRYSGYVAVVSPTVGFAEEHGGVNATADKGAFIGSMRLGLNHDLGWGSLGVYGQAEYLSYVPGVGYNNNDQAGGSPWGLQGSQNGTHITSEDAMNYTGGVSLTVKLK